MTLFVCLPATGFAGDDHEALEAAQNFANEFAIAQAGGADLSKIRGVRTAIEELSAGVEGRGRYAKMIFQVQGVSPSTARRSAAYLSYDRNVLRYSRPLHYTNAWTVGRVNQKQAKRSSSLSRLLAERTAQSFARVYDTARAAGAQLHQVRDVESAMAILEKGTHGEGALANTKFHITKAGANTRFLAKKLLRFEEGHLYYIKNADRMNADQVTQKIKRSRPAHLAQQTVALYNTACGVGAEFKSARTPADIVDSLRFGEKVDNELGSQIFRFSINATEADWKRCVAYLRLRDQTLSYVPPSS